MARRDRLHNSVTACYPRVCRRPVWDFYMNVNEGLMFSLPVLDKRTCIGGKCSPEIIISATPLHINRHKCWDSPTLTLSHNSSDRSSLYKQQVHQRWGLVFFLPHFWQSLSFKTCKIGFSELLCLKTWILTDKQPLFCGVQEKGTGNHLPLASKKQTWRSNTQRLMLMSQYKNYNQADI